MRQSAADVMHFDPLAGAGFAAVEIALCGAQFRIAIIAVVPDQSDCARNLLIAVVTAQQGAQVVSTVGEQA